MNLKDQVLSIDQVQELQELGFDVNKYASVEVNITEKGNKFIISKEFIKLFPKFGDNNVIKRYYSMTIGDIMDILPNLINTERFLYRLEINNSSVYYTDRIKNTGIYFYDKGLIDNLFETLKWCIKEKHIEL